MLCALQNRDCVLAHQFHKADIMDRWVCRATRGTAYAAKPHSHTANTTQMVITWCKTQWSESRSPLIYHAVFYNEGLFVMLGVGHRVALLGVWMVLNAGSHFHLTVWRRLNVSCRKINGHFTNLRHYLRERSDPVPGGIAVRWIIQGLFC